MRQSVSALVVLASIALSLAAVEGLLRLAGFSYPSFHQPDPRLGIRLRPQAEGWSRQEGEAYVRISSAGMRDGEIAPAKPGGTVRIAVLGDSFMEALQVEEEEAFASRLQHALGSCRALGGRRIETLNFGVSNYGTAQQLLLLRSRVWQYAPDFVLLAFFVGNDVRNNSAALERGRSRPFYVLRNGRLSLDASFADDAGFRRTLALSERLAPLHDLRLYQLARKARASVQREPRVGAALTAGAALPALSEQGFDDSVLRAPPDAAWRDAWLVTEQLLGRMAAEVRARGVPFMVATIAPGAAAYPDPRLRSRYARHLGEPDLFYAERRIRRLGETLGFPVLMLGPTMQRHADATAQFLYGFSNTLLGFGHWNEAGHRVAAQAAAPAVCEALG